MHQITEYPLYQFPQDRQGEAIHSGNHAALVALAARASKQAEKLLALLALAPVEAG